MNNVINDLESQLPEVSPDQVIQSGNVTIQTAIDTELAKWDSKKEGDDSVYQFLADYWSSIGLKESEWTPGGTPWSAAWVSWVHRNSGFPGSASHQQYTRDIIAGRGGNWVAYSLAKNPQIQPQIGDVVVRPRGGGSATLTSADPEWWWSHGDVIYKINPDGLGVPVGGNLSDSVKSQSPVGADNWGNYLIILKNKKKQIDNWKIALFALTMIGLWMSRKK